MNIKQIKALNIWESATLMTWMSYSTKAISLVGILPLVLKQFTPEDVVLWYLFSTIIGIQSLADFGFRQTFSRIISFAFAGATDIDIFNYKDSKSHENSSVCNTKLLSSIINVMMFLYRWLTVIVLILMITLGSLSMVKPISGVNLQTEAWISWGVVIFASCISFYSRVYLNFLEGLNKIALVRRVETFTSLGAIFSSMVVLIWFPSLLNLVIVHQFWLIVSSLRDWYLCKIVNNNLFEKVYIKQPLDISILRKIWAPAWRSGIGGLMSAGLTNLTSIIYAQFGNTASVAGYLLAIRLITQIREVSMAPFYSKLPVLAMLRAKSDIVALKLTAKRGMKISHVVFLVGFILTSLCINPFLEIINSKVTFVSMHLWGLLGLAFFAHRFGAMHLQIYITTNHVISHIADGVSGILFILSAVFLSKYIGIYSIPVGMLTGYLLFYAWYTASHSYKSLGNESFWAFERTTSLPMAIILFVFFIISLMFY